MNALYNLSLRFKLMFPIVLITLVLAFTTILSLFNFKNLESSVDKIAHEFMPELNYLLQADRDMYQAQVAERSMIFVKEGSDDFKKLIKQHDENIQQARERVEKFFELTQAEQTKAFSAPFFEAYEKWVKTTERIEHERSNNGRRGRSTAIELSFGDAATQFNAARDILDQLTEIVEEHAESEVKYADSAVSKASTVQVSALIIGILICILLILFFPGLVIHPLRQMQRKVDDLSKGDGDLTTRLEIAHMDELGQLAGSIDSFLDNLQQLIKQTVDTTKQVSNAAENQSHITNQTSDTIIEQHSAIDQVATAVTEMAATVQEVEQSASDAAAAAKHADENAKRGQQVVGITISAIKELANDVDNAAQVIGDVEKDSENIGSVLDVIKNIADQTNLLALNAAIEAARAGEQGRGFAVVADEVRSLASRTQSSTQEIQAMIEKLQTATQNAVKVMNGGQEKAQGSVEQATEAGTSLDEITNAVAQISDMNLHIANAAKEQNAVTEEISRNISHITDLSNQTSANADDSRNASSDLADLATDLQQNVGRFKV